MGVNICWKGLLGDKAVSKIRFSSKRSSYRCSKWDLNKDTVAVQVKMLIKQDLTDLHSKQFQVNSHPKPQLTWIIQKQLWISTLCPLLKAAKTNTSCRPLCKRIPNKRTHRTIRTQICKILTTQCKSVWINKKCNLNLLSRTARTPTAAFKFNNRLRTKLLQTRNKIKTVHSNKCFYHTLTGSNRCNRGT